VVGRGSHIPPENLTLPGHLPLPPRPCARWLRLWIDHRLKFDRHCERWAAKARMVAGTLLRLNKTLYGAPPGALSAVARACVTQVALYGSEAWFRDEGRQPVALRHAESATAAAARAVVPHWRRSPQAALYRESGLWPAVIELRRKRDKLGLRVAQADKQHPLRPLAEAPHELGKRSGRPVPRTSL